jgi:hypothetical protein
MDKIEAIVDALGNCNGMNNPESEAYRLRNPILQRSFAKPGKHIIDDKGRRVFDSLQAGYKAATFDVSLKLSGHSRAGLKPEDHLINLLGCYGINQKLAIDKVVNFLRKSLCNQEVSAKTPLSYFLAKDSEGN